jgi:hypothetical protein
LFETSRVESVFADIVHLYLTINLTTSNYQSTFKMAPLKNLLSATILATCAFAAPALKTRQSGGFYLIAIHSTSPIQGQAINAVGSNFYIGLPATTSCPELPEYCPDGPATETIFVGNNEEGTLYLVSQAIIDLR